MTLYRSIFTTSLCINALTTFRSTRYWDKLLKFFLPLDKSMATNEKKEPNELLTDSKRKLKKNHELLIQRYLSVYLLAALSDWLQGPYVYALYDAYGYSQRIIAILFVAGFGSSMIFGSFIGGLADTYGRRNFALLFAVTYLLSCITKHFHNYWTLLLGRILGGIATSLLFSVFDSWLIRCHTDNAISSYLSLSFSISSYGNSLVAILAGLLAEQVANEGKFYPLFGNLNGQNNVIFVGGYLNPFDVAIVTLIFCAIFTICFWEENYGNESSNQIKTSKNTPYHENFKYAFNAMIHSKKILFCGIISSLFEGCMYIFVFMWTPHLKLKSKDNNLPFGLIFSIFMNFSMSGSSLFAVLIQKKYKCQNLCLCVLITAAVSFTLMSFSDTHRDALLGFFLFEFCVGMYYPIMGTMKSEIVPEDKRSTIYNIYRIPLNFIVLFILLTDLSPLFAFKLCATMLTFATVLQWKLLKEHRNVPIIISLSSKLDQSIESGNVVLMAENHVNEIEIHKHKSLVKEH